MGPRRFSKVSELAEKIGPKKTALAAVEKTPVLDPEALAKAEAEAKAAFDQEKLQEYLATEIAPKQEKAIQRRKELKADELEEAIAKSQQGREFSGYKNWAEGGPTTEELRRAALERFQRDKAEGVRDIDLSKLKAAGIGGVAIGAGMVASPLARADEGPTVSQSNPEFNSSSTTSKVLKNAVSEAEKKYGTYDLAGGFQKTLEGIDKYTGRPMRAAALSALKGESPITGAIQSVSEDKDVEGREVARKFLEKAEEHGMRLRAPVDPKLEQLRQLGVEIEGKKPEEYLPSNDFAAEAPVGLAADMILDPTNVVGMGLGTKAGKGFSKVLGLIK